MKYDPKLWCPKLTHERDPRRSPRCPKTVVPEKTVWCPKLVPEKKRTHSLLESRKPEVEGAKLTQSLVSKQRPGTVLGTVLGTWLGAQKKGASMPPREKLTWMLHESR